MSRAAVTGHGSAEQMLPETCLLRLTNERESQWQSRAPLSQTACPVDSYRCVNNAPIAYRRTYVGSLQGYQPQDLPTSAGKSTWFAGEELTGAGENLVYLV